MNHWNISPAWEFLARHLRNLPLWDIVEVSKSARYQELRCDLPIFLYKIGTWYTKYL